MKILKITLIVLSIFIYSKTTAQDTIVHQNVEKITKVYEKTNYGPNSTHYIYTYQALNFFTPAIYENQYQINYVKSIDFYYGITYKLKLTNWFSNGLSIFYNLQNINLKKQLATGYSAQMKDKIILNNLGAEYFWRFSLAKHGNTIGKYIDLGIWGKYNFNNRYIIKTQQNNSLYSSNKQKQVFNNTNLFAPYFYGVSFRIGSKQFSFVAKYTLSDIFGENAKQLINIFDLPKLTLGIEIAIVR